MITAREHVSRLAEITGFEESELRTVDKFLADAGLRRKSLGRAYVQISTKESLLVLLGVMGAPVKSVCDSYVEDVSRFSLLAHGIRTRDGSANELPALIGLSEADLGDMTLIDVLVRMARHLASLNPSGARGSFGGRVWIEVVTNGPVTIQIDSAGFRGEIQFVGPTATRFGDGQRLATVSNFTLAWIGRNTEAE